MCRANIDELLGDGFIVLIDRYIHTNLAYSQFRVGNTLQFPFVITDRA